MSQGFANPYNAPGRLIGVQVLTGSGTYTPTTGTSFVIIEALAAGGGGGAASTDNTIGGGGCAGGYIMAFWANPTAHSLSLIHI